MVLRFYLLTLDEESLKTYHDVIVNELLPSASSLKKAKTSMMTFTNELSPTVVRQALLSPLQKFNPYTLTPTSQTALLQPKKSVRYISKTPYKVLDAPELQDDFYLNLVDWSKLNFLGVGLGTCVYLWSANNSKVDKLCDLGPYDSVTSVNWIQKGSHIAVGTNRGLVQLWDVQKMKKIRQFTDHKARVGSISWNESLLTSGSRDRSILLRDVRDSSDTVRRYTGHRQEVCGLKWNPEGNQLASGGNDNKLLIWDIRQTSPITQFSDHIAAVKAISWSPHTHGILASGGGTADKCIRIWNTSTSSLLNHIDTGSQVCNLAWSKNSSEIVSTHGYSQNQINIWKYPSMQCSATLTGHSFRVLYLAMSPDGQNIVTGAGDETLRFWTVFNKSNNHKSKEHDSLLTIR
ncbi:WD40-repeat-containing domain protein [Globomyces pollinis-pini]|nr:WD40-repeat-containing domain protein [Globomyces pollinis-pini]